MEMYWIPGVNNLRAYGRAFAEPGDVWAIESELAAAVGGLIAHGAAAGRYSSNSAQSQCTKCWQASASASRSPVVIA